MAKVKCEEATTIQLNFDLFDLPTAQHKAGLAGLILQIRSMQGRAQEFSPKQIPEISDMTSVSVTVTLTQTSLQATIDDLYSAKLEEVMVASKWQEQKPKRTEEITESDPQSGESKKSKRFVYDVVQPNSPFLRQYYPAGEADWLKLWRDMIWNIPRAKPTTRGPFNERAEGKQASESAKIWKTLVAFEKAREKNQFRTCSVSSALLLGAQAINAESVKFSERSDFALLLHFWQLTVLVFVPQQIDKDGKGEFVGYSLAIPEVSDLKRFCQELPKVLAELDTQKRGYRPAAAIIDIPDQAGLEFMRHLRAITGHEKSQSTRIRRSVHSVEFVHLVKAGNNVKTMASGQVSPSDDLLKEYTRIIQSGPQALGFRNPLFRAGQLRSLLRGTPWYHGMGDMLVRRDWTFFIRCSETPRSMPWFSSDAARQFATEQSKFDLKKERYGEMPDETKAAEPRPETPVSLLVHRLVKTYVRRKTESRCGIEWKSFKDRKIKDDNGVERMDVPKEYREAKEKVASSAYLAMRSRRDQDFADYFTATICSVGQFLTEDEFKCVANALLNDTSDVKTLTLLALSANS